MNNKPETKYSFIQFTSEQYQSICQEIEALRIAADGNTVLKEIENHPYGIRVKYTTLSDKEEIKTEVEYLKLINELENKFWRLRQDVMYGDIKRVKRELFEKYKC